jgi:hypothetical protein
MALFPTLAPPTIEHITGWVSFQDEEVQLAQEEAELEAKVQTPCSDYYMLLVLRCWR